MEGWDAAEDTPHASDKCKDNEKVECGGASTEDDLHLMAWMKHESLLLEMYQNGVFAASCVYV